MRTRYKMPFPGDTQAQSDPRSPDAAKRNPGAWPANARLSILRPSITRRFIEATPLRYLEHKNSCAHDAKHPSPAMPKHNDPRSPDAAQRNPGAWADDTMLYIARPSITLRFIEAT